MPTPSYMKTSETSDGGGFITGTYWLELGNHGRPLPPAFAVAFNTDAYTPSIFTALGIQCSPEIQRAVVKRQAEFLAGRLAARQAIARLGISTVQLGTGYLRRPLWPNGVTGSITHTNTVSAAIAISADMVRGIGIDVERVMDTNTAETIRDTVLTGRELLLFAARNCCIDFNMFLTVAFSAKESFFKATSLHVGRYFEFHALRLIHFDMANGRITFTIAEELSPALRAGETFYACFKVIDDQTVLTSFVW